MILLKLTLLSLWNRRASLLLTILAIAISITLLLSVEYIRKEAKASFLSTISGTDLVVGARSGSVQLLLYSVFRIGNATNNISWKSYQELAANPLIEWTVPLSLGDSHKGFRVLGTNQDYFRYYRFGDKHTLEFAQGQTFSGVFETVLGAEVARKLGYKLGDKIVIAHGTSKVNTALHADKPFTVIGILKPTGTPLDRTVHITLEGLEAVHLDWVAGTKINGYNLSAEAVLKKNLQPKLITAFLVGLQSRAAAFRVQREINDYKREPLLAILPGVTLADLWQALGLFETVLRMISGLVVVAGLVGMLTTVLSTLNERRREMAILRAVGAHPRHILLLFILEALVLTLVGCLIGMMFMFALVYLARPWVIAEYGFYLRTWLPDLSSLSLVAIVASLALVLSLLPGTIAYRRSLQDGLTIRT
ncbi:putative ABC transport system permease protein [Thiothrix eikelboomii]|uniref:Putative ABC transport system permease protein n=1 Tax=Thiothrix eikelboomii TaxID=92487 RepID=A0A1T4W5J4_9GAMM|nr:ABC transporter permease [Thiothrix eikelboomii]SKA72467.1 putative ABC transport system permease protein [Thiothrix eikelboomii]